MKAFLTVIGKDKVGIVAAISDELFKLNVNIIDITQTIMDDFFTMVVMVDLEKSSKSFDEIKKALKERGEAIGVEAKIQREEIFNKMHRI
ncbi:ACT domain-containing protein [Intestinibacter bartlettii]|uniref:ACT domain-containing protein n=1 Tax=Intestinibacter bartlettii TaxID=261299 RepID=UPI000822EE21|nr:ACT domain-containing protein [Intestinibacter bartlettii]SCI64051.1 ACT domain-containing protein [uncultured Clostridium sp.]